MKGTNVTARRLALTAMLALTLGTIAGVRPTSAQAGVVVDVDVAPPEPRVVVAPPPRAGFVWAPGYWFWNGHAHAWHDGYWVHERPGYHWVADRWVARGPHYHYQRGHWER
jgi:hypothetical protein